MVKRTRLAQARKCVTANVGTNVKHGGFPRSKIKAKVDTTTVPCSLGQREQCHCGLTGCITARSVAGTVGGVVNTDTAVISST